jgi:hypothetical protein
MSSNEVEMQPKYSLDCTLERELRVLEMLTAFFAAAGNAPDTAEGLALMAKFLSKRADLPTINAALERCLVECRYPIRLPEIIQRLPGTEAGDVNAEKRIAWETVEKFASKYVGNDVHGNYGPDFGWYGPRFNYRGELVRPASYPRLPGRILDAVRRTGGWKAYALMTSEDYPHQQKRFFEEYEAWVEVERISDRARLLETPRGKELVAAKAMEPERPRAPALAPTAAAAPMSPQKARIMKAIANVGKPMR